MYVYRLTITLHDLMFYASRELGRMYISEQCVHNYALTYALGLATSSYYDDVQIPHYREDLEPLNDMSVYVTPAKPVRTETVAHTFKFADTRYHVKMEQTSVNIPGYGRAHELIPESVFEAYVISQNARTFPRWIRLGKWLSKANVDVAELDFDDGDGAFACHHPLNPLDVSAEPLLYDLINIPPVSLIENARFEGRHYVLHSVGKELLRLPHEMRYGF